jgi:uncharacterized protein YlxW (UPF0749 family)
MVGLVILTVSFFIALMFAAYKYEQLEADNELYDNLLEDCHDREAEANARVKDLQETIDKAMEGAMQLVIENIDLNSTIDMLAEAEVALNFPEEVNE